VLQSGEVGAWAPPGAEINVRGRPSNAPLRDLVAGGTFRTDLFYRLSAQRRTAALRAAPAMSNPSPATSCSVSAGPGRSVPSHA
jgi:hypothetical protein